MDIDEHWLTEHERVKIAMRMIRSEFVTAEFISRMTWLDKWKVEDLMHHKKHTRKQIITLENGETVCFQTNMGLDEIPSFDNKNEFIKFFYTQKEWSWVYITRP